MMLMLTLMLTTSFGVYLSIGVVIVLMHMSEFGCFDLYHLMMSSLCRWLHLRESVCQCRIESLEVSAIRLAGKHILTTD